MEKAGCCSTVRRVENLSLRADSHDVRSGYVKRLWGGLPLPLPLGEVAERSEDGEGRHVLPARRAGRSSPAARRQRNPLGAGTGRPPAGGPSVGHRGLPAGGHPGHAPKTAGHPTPQQAATTTAPPHGTPPPPTPQNQTGAAAARAAPPTGGAIQIVAPAAQSHPRLRGKAAGDTGGGVGGKHHAGQEAQARRAEAPRQRRRHQRGDAAATYCVRGPLFKGWCGGSLRPKT